MIVKYGEGIQINSRKKKEDTFECDDEDDEDDGDYENAIKLVIKEV